MSKNEKDKSGLPLKLTPEQKELAAKLRTMACETGVFDQEEFEQIPLAHGFIDCMAMAIGFAGQKNMEAVTGSFKLAFNHFYRAMEDEAKVTKFPLDQQPDDPPF